MLNKLKKLFKLYKIVQTKPIVEPVLRVLNQLPQRRLPDRVFNEVQSKKFFLPLQALFYLYNWLKYETITEMPDSRFVINSFLPPMPGKGYERMFENLLSGRRLSPVSAYIAVTSKCYYNCWHCSYNNRSGDDLTLNQVISVIDQLVNIGTSIIGITGGEPTLRDDLVSIVSYASSKADCMIFTNGYNLTDELARQLKEAGLWGVAVSIDSHLPEIHNEKRSSDQAFSLAIKAIEISKKYSFYTMLTTVPDVNMLKDGTYKKIYDLASQLSVDEFRIVEPMPTGKILSCKECLLDDQLREELNQFHKYINQRNLKPKVCSFALIESENYFGCCAGTMHLFIDSAGYVCPCDFTPLSFGNIKEEPLSVCWERLNSAFKLPRNRCFILEYYPLIQQYYSGTLPIDYNITLKIMENVFSTDLPAYFKHVLSVNNNSE